MAQKINQHIVIPHPSLVVSNQTLIHAQHLTRLDHQSCFFASFTGDRFRSDGTKNQSAHSDTAPVPRRLESNAHTRPTSHPSRPPILFLRELHGRPLQIGWHKKSIST